MQVRGSLLLSAKQINNRLGIRILFSRPRYSMTILIGEFPRLPDTFPSFNRELYEEYKELVQKIITTLQLILYKRYSLSLAVSQYNILLGTLLVFTSMVFCSIYDYHYPLNTFPLFGLRPHSLALVTGRSYFVNAPSSAYGLTFVSVYFPMVQ